jgi:hypothetical protein
MNILFTLLVIDPFRADRTIWRFPAARSRATARALGVLCDDFGGKGGDVGHFFTLSRYFITQSANSKSAFFLASENKRPGFSLKNFRTKSCIFISFPFLAIWLTIPAGWQDRSSGSRRRRCRRFAGQSLGFSL